MAFHRPAGCPKKHEEQNTFLWMNKQWHPLNTIRLKPWASLGRQQREGGGRAAHLPISRHPFIGRAAGWQRLCSALPFHEGVDLLEEGASRRRKKQQEEACLQCARQQGSKEGGGREDNSSNLIGCRYSSGRLKHARSNMKNINSLLYTTFEQAWSLNGTLITRTTHRTHHRALKHAACHGGTRGTAPGAHLLPHACLPGTALLPHGPRRIFSALSTRTCTRTAARCAAQPQLLCLLLPPFPLYRLHTCRAARHVA